MEQATNVKSMVEHFYHWEKTTPDKVFLRQPKGDIWKTYTYAEAGQQARKITTALKSMGLKPGDHIGILSKNCAHWVIADLAIMIGGYVSVPFYASLPTQQLAEVLSLSDVKMVFLGKLDVWGDKDTAFPEGVQAIKFPHYDGNATVTIGQEWETLLSQHQAETENFVPDLDSLWTIKFTSGTTGTPKGVMLDHRAPGQIAADEKKTNWLGSYEKIKDFKTFSFLPLNHVAERSAVEMMTIVRGGTISFAENLDTFAKNIQETQPTLFFAVPRIWNKFYLGVLANMDKKKLDFLLKIPIVSGIVKKKVRTALGLRDVKVAATGAAITAGFLKDFYKKLGIHLIEAYGMTEVCGSMTNSPDLDSPVDSVGRVIPFGEVKIHPETGEILMKSPYVMKGYYKNPEKTAEVLRDGWIHSGDKGRMDSRGYVYVTGRVTDAFKTSKGSYVTPNKMEEEILNNDYVEQVCVAGLGVPHPLALLNLSELAGDASKEEIEQSLWSTIEEVNSTRANFEKICRVIVLKETWSDANGLLTPTLKIRRGKINDMYGQHFLEWCEAKDQVLWA